MTDTAPGVRHGGNILANALAAQGMKPGFGVPSESYLPELDGFCDLCDRLRFIVCRQKGGASHIGNAYGKLTGEPGVRFVTLVPGPSDGAIGVHNAFRGSMPMAAFVGQLGNEFAERESFHKVD
jgi:acetolactate synthase I/II/III large subunit